MKMPMTQEATVSSEIKVMLSKKTVKLDMGKRVLYIPLYSPKRNHMSLFIMSIKPLNNFITCTKFKISPRNRKAFHPGYWTILLNITSAYCHIPIVKRLHYFLLFRLKGKIYQDRTLSFRLSIVPKHFESNEIAPTLLLEHGYNTSLYLNGVLILANSYS